MHFEQEAQRPPKVCEDVWQTVPSTLSRCAWPQAHYWYEYIRGYGLRACVDALLAVRPLIEPLSTPLPEFEPHMGQVFHAQW